MVSHHSPIDIDQLKAMVEQIQKDLDKCYAPTGAQPSGDPGAKVTVTEEMLKDESVPSELRVQAGRQLDYMSKAQARFKWMDTGSYVVGSWAWTFGLTFARNGSSDALWRYEVYVSVGPRTLRIGFFRPKAVTLDNSFRDDFTKKFVKVTDEYVPTEADERW
jgi:hypothetical protein